MSWFRGPPKEKERYYLLPGMGGRAYRRKQRVILRYTVVAGLIISACLAWALYYFSHPHHI